MQTIAFEIDPAVWGKKKKKKKKNHKKNKYRNISIKKIINAQRKKRKKEAQMVENLRAAFSMF